MGNLSIDLLYGNAAGRGLLKFLLKAGLPKLMTAYLSSRLSKPLISKYIRDNNISMEGYPECDYLSFADFFSRKKEEYLFDSDPNHFISPADSLLSANRITPDSSFSVKGLSYRLSDLIEDSQLAESFYDGLCLIFRLTASDYHHYIYPDSGFIHEGHFIKGQLHSVQPIALASYPIFRLNRRCWTLFDSDNFNQIVQIQVGAMAVGGIVNEDRNARVVKGNEMGHFELCGSSILLLLKKNRLKLLPEIDKITSSGGEYPVKLGMHIGDTF